MGYITEFQYAEINKRKLLYFNPLLSFFILGIIFSDFISIADFYLPFQPVSGILAAAALLGIGSGNGFARLIFKLTKLSRPVYIISEILFITSASIFFLRDLIFSAGKMFSDPMIDIFMIHPLLPLVGLCAVFFIQGIKTAYVYKIGCGEFIDNRNGAVKIPIFILTGLAAGLLKPLISLYFEIDGAFYVILPAILAPCIFLINLSYNPVSLYAKVFERDSADEKEIAPTREGLFFTYLNAAFIVIYIFLGYLMITKISGEIFYVKLATVSIILFFLIAGYLAGMLFKIAPFNAYTGAVFPIVFTASVFIMTVKTSGSNPLWGLTFAPAALLFGLSLNHQFRSIVSHFDHKKRFSILNIILLTLPIPVLISMNLINFSNGVFFITVYTAAFVNLIIPAVNLAGKGIRFSVKGIYLLIILVLIPATVVIHLFLKIPVNNAQFTTPVKNFDDLKNINYNSPFVKGRITIEYSGLPVFSVNDSIIRNLKRAVVPIALFIDNKTNEKSPILFIDGNQQFFRNPLLGLFKNQICLDPVSDWATGGRQLPFSGRQRYIPETDFPLNYLAASKDKFQIIVDIHNLYDQRRNLYKFSDDYHRLIKRSLITGGIYANVINLQSCRGDFLYSAVQSLKKNFSSHTVFLFSDVLIIFSTDSAEKLTLTREKIYSLADFIKSNEEAREIFFSEYHVLSRIIFTSIEELESYIAAPQVKPDRLAQAKDFVFDDNTASSFAGENKKFLKLVPGKGTDIYFLNEASAAASRLNQSLTLLKKFEFSESSSRYDTETANLFELKRYSEYIPELSVYLKNILAYKIHYYKGAALAYEKEKSWQEAKILYLAMLQINNNDFEANYRLGILYLMLQDIENSFKYLQNALALDKNNPTVLLQMGILNFTSGKTTEAIAFLNSALENKERSAALYKYLGLCYEKIGNTEEAASNFQKALILDPNDSETVKKIDEYKKQKERENKLTEQPEQKSDIEVEHDESIDIPVNRSAYEIRLGEKGEGSLEGPPEKK